MAAAVVLLVMVYLVVNGHQLGPFAEIASLAMVMSLAIVLGLLTYDIKTIYGALSIIAKKKTENTTGTKRILAQLALYSLVSGIVFAIIQILPLDAGVNSAEAYQLALWSLLYGVLMAIGLWVISGLDKPETSITMTKNKESDENQIIMAFCVLLLTVGVLSLLFVEMYHMDGLTDQQQGNEVAVDTNQGLQLGEDMVWRPAKLVEQSNTQGAADYDIPLQPKKKINTTKNNGDPEVKEKHQAPLRWELTLGSD